MSNPYPPPPKRLVRSTSNRVIGGVCGGVADYLNMDANLVRILTVLISVFTGVPVILYIIALFVMPEDTAAPAPPPPHVTGAPTYQGPFSTTGPSEPAYAPYPAPGAQPGAGRPSAEDAVWGVEGPPWEQRQPEPAPSSEAPAASPTPAASPPAAEPVAPAEPEAPVVPPAEGGSKPAGEPPRS